MCGGFPCGPRPDATRTGSDAGKLSAFYDRGYPRDLFDAGLIPDIPGLDPAKLRTAFVVYGGGARADWRAVCRESPTIQSAALARQLRSALTTTDAQRTRPIGADAFLAELTAKAAPAQRMVVPLTPTEVEFPGSWTGYSTTATSPPSSSPPTRHCSRVSLRSCG